MWKMLVERSCSFAQALIRTASLESPATVARAVEAIHAILRDQLPIDEFRVCYHDDADRCSCRKPLPGMLLQAAADLGLDLSASCLVGDRWRDVEAGIAAGCSTYFIDYGYDEQKPQSITFKVSSLYEAALIILNGGGNEKD